jgi:hypothetical protein
MAWCKYGIRNDDICCSFKCGGSNYLLWTHRILEDGETVEHYPFSTSNQDPSYCGGVGCNYYGSGDKYLPAENNLAGVHPEHGGGGPELCCKSRSWLKLPPRLLPFDDTAPSSRPVAPGAELRPLLRIPEHSTSILEACHGHAPIARLRTPQDLEVLMSEVVGL